MSVPSQRFEQFYRIPASRIDTIRERISASIGSDGTGSFQMAVSENTPHWWKKMASAAGTKDKLSGRILVSGRRDTTVEAVAARVVFDPVTFPKIRAVTQAVLEYANTAVTIALSLIGIMALWLGIMKIAEAAGVIGIITRWLSPVMTRLFPEVPPDHPAMGAMVMNMAANVLGLSNAATPFGLKAMEELDTLNPKKGTATNAMVTFLAINTAGLTLIPATAIAVRVGLGSASPAVIIGTSIVGATCATIVGIGTAKLLQRLPFFKKQLDVPSADGRRTTVDGKGE
jgi:spore maturation protein A